MPYNIRKQKCKQSDGDAGSYTLSYTDNKGKKHSACHTSRKKAQGQIAAIEMPRESNEPPVSSIEESLLHTIVRRYASLAEAPLTRNEIGKRPWRMQRVIEFIKTGTPFKVGRASPFEEKVITVQIQDQSTGKVISDNSDLSNKRDLAAFIDWVQKGTSSKFEVLPVWDDSVNSWALVYKDPTNFQYETAKEGSFGEKSLTPVTLGVAGDPIGIGSLASTVKASITGKFDENSAIVLNGLLDGALSVRKSKSAELSYKIPSDAQEILSGLSDSDKRSIVKDFGEILAAAAIARAYGYRAVAFPASISNPLTDFEVHTPSNPSDPDPRGFSVKGLSGSGASIKNYMDSLAALAKSPGRKVSPDERSAALSISSTAGLSLHDAVLSMAQSEAFADQPEVKETLSKLSTALGKSLPLTASDVVQSIRDSRNPKSIIKKYYSMGLPAAPRGSIDDVLSAGFSDDLVKSVCIYPILRAMLSAMNSENSSFRRAVSRAMNSMAVSQAFINFDDLTSPSLVTISISEFSGIGPDSIRFLTKAGATTFKQGGIGVSIHEGKIMNDNGYVLRQLIKEELTSADKKEIEKIARRQAELALGRELGSDVMKTIRAEVEKVTEKTLGGKESQAQIEELVVSVVKRLYKDITVGR